MRKLWRDFQMLLLFSFVFMNSFIIVSESSSHCQMCMHVAAGKKCLYIGNCTFAHSSEEKELWTFMKDNNSKLFHLIIRY